MAFQLNESDDLRRSDMPAQRRPEPARLDAWLAAPEPGGGAVPDVMDFLADLDRRRSQLLQRLRAASAPD
jgi:hypothetical protein